MRIKRLISLALCLVMLCLTLVSCNEDEIGAYLGIYNYEPEQVVNMEFDFYIIVGEGTTAAAKTTVQDKINQYLQDKYNTKINIQFISDDDYAGVVAEAVAASASTDVILKQEDKNNDRVIDPLRVNGGKILLVAGEKMMNSLLETGKLHNLSDFLTTNAFGTLNTSIPEVLVDAARGENGELFCIPNNHVIGEYEYVLINRVEAIKCNKNETELRKYVSDEDIADLEADINKDGQDNVKVVTGKYEDRAEHEKNGWICNVRKYPHATATEAFASAFAIIPEKTVYFDANGDGVITEADYKDYDRNGDIVGNKEMGCLADKNEVARRALEVVYSINTDPVLRNYLLYGIENINYEINKDGYVVYKDGDDTTYHMPIMYTGNMFLAKYIERDYDGNAWTSDMYENGKLQNKDAE